jgi:hypothetical protein
MAPEPNIDIGAAAHAAVVQFGADPVALQVGLSRAYLGYGIMDWSFTDEKGDKVPIRHRDPAFYEVIQRLLPFGNGGFHLANEADRLYSDVVLAPLQAAMARAEAEKQSQSSQNGPTDDATSPIPMLGREARRRSSRSSRTSSAGKRSGGRAG